MAGFKKFEEIKAWQKARTATKVVYQIATDGKFAKDFSLRDQIRRSCVSIMANIAEGQGRGGAAGGARNPRIEGAKEGNTEGGGRGEGVILDLADIGGGDDGEDQAPLEVPAEAAPRGLDYLQVQTDIGLGDAQQNHGSGRPGL